MSLDESKKPEEVKQEEAKIEEQLNTAKAETEETVADLKAEEVKKLRAVHEKAVTEMIVKLEAVFVEDGKTVQGALDAMAQCYVGLTCNFIEGNKDNKVWAEDLVNRSFSWVANTISDAFEEAHGTTLFGIPARERVAKPEKEV